MNVRDFKDFNDKIFQKKKVKIELYRIKVEIVSKSYLVSPAECWISSFNFSQQCRKGSGVSNTGNGGKTEGCFAQE